MTDYTPIDVVAALFSPRSVFRLWRLRSMPKNREGCAPSACGGKARRVAEAEGAGARQRLLADYAPRIQHGAERIHRVVQGGAAAGLQQGHGECVAGITRGPRARLVLDHHP